MEGIATVTKHSNNFDYKIVNVSKQINKTYYTTKKITLVYTCYKSTYLNSSYLTLDKYIIGKHEANKNVYVIKTENMFQISRYTFIVSYKPCIVKLIEPCF